MSRAMPPRVFLGLSSLASITPPSLTWLSAPEADRLAGMAAPRRRAQFIAGRWLLRQVLAAAYGGDAHTGWPLSAADNGPPTLLRPPAGPPIHLSLSHGVDHVCCAAGDVRMGIDIETRGRVRDWAGLTTLVCGPAEAERIRAAADQAVAFLTMWTLKEAWIKRHAAAMSPALLASLTTTPPQQAPEPANARVWLDDHFVMALAAPAEATISWVGAFQQPAGLPVPWRIDRA